MTKYKVGERVRIISDIGNLLTANIGFVPPMKPYLGEIATIVSVIEGGVHNAYLLDIDREWFWHEKLLVKIYENIKLEDVDFKDLLLKKGGK